MEQKLVKVPFEVEMAKKITNGEVEGKIVTREGNSVRIVCWDRKDITYNIAALVDNGDEEDFKSYTNEGIWNTDKICTLKRYDLMLEIPEYMTFKDGGVLYVRLKNNNWYIFIYSCNSEYKTDSYAALGDNGRLWIEGNYITSNDCISELRFATEEEKQKLIEALKASKEPKAKECLKMLGIEQKQEYGFEPFDKVLVRDDDSQKWRIDLFSHQRDNGLYVGLECSWRYCIHYNDQTAHLLGTTGGWEE